MIRAIICFVSVVAVSGINHDGLRIKYGDGSDEADLRYFYKVPRTLAEVEAEGWRRTERPQGPMEQLVMYCPPGRVLCPLYASTGFVAGLQIAILEEAIDPVLKPEKKFVRWTSPADEGEPSRVYWTATQYFISPELLETGDAPTIDNGQTLQHGGVWVSGVDGELMKIPLKEDDIQRTLFKKQNCYPNMGTHYYYNTSKESDCEALLPWFALVKEGELLGVGFQTFGGPPARGRERQWFEDVAPGRVTSLLAVPTAQECYHDLFEIHGLLSMHVYYINDPWNIKCKSEDSIKPSSIIKWLTLSGYRYANKLWGDIRRLASGYLVRRD